MKFTLEENSSIHEKPRNLNNCTFMDNYKKAVKYYAERKEDYVLHNEGNEHALIIFENMFRYSNSHIRIVAKDMANVEVVNTEEYIEAMKSFLDKPNTKLDIILSNFEPSVNDIPANKNFFKFLVHTDAYKNKRVRVKISNKKAFKLNGKLAHFCTSDGHAYRMEHDIDKRKAWCNFGSPDTTSKIDEMFDNAFNGIEGELELTTMVN